MFFHLVTNLMMNHTQNFCRYPTLVARRKKNLPLFLYQAKNLPNDSIHTKGHHYQFVCGKKYNNY